MHLRSKTPGKQRRPWQRILVGISIVSVGIILAGIFSTTDGIPGEAAQLPPSLRRWTQPEAPASTEVLEAFKRGVDQYNNKRYSSALDALPGEKDAKTTAVSDYILLYRAKSNLAMERNREALDDFRLLENTYPDSSLTEEALMGQCQALLQLNDSKSVLAILGRLKTKATSETLYYRARALDQMAEKDQAVARYLEIYSRYPATKFSPLAERSLRSLSPQALKGARNYDVRLERAENLLKVNDARGARSLLLGLGKVPAPNSESSQKQRLLMGEADYRLGRTRTALSYVRKVTRADPALHARALYLEGACCRRLDREQAFLSLRDKALELYPRSKETEELCYSVATYYDVNYESAKAREAYKVLYRAFPKGRRSDSALWKLSLFSYLEKQYGEAACGFWNYLRAYSDPLPASSAMYWMGRCYERAGEFGNAHYLYDRTVTLANSSYYGQRAREAEAALQKSGSFPKNSVSGIDFKQVVEACNGIQFAPVALPEPDEAGARIIERARQLVSAGLQDLALSELRWGSRRYPRNEVPVAYVVSRIHLSMGDYYESIAFLRRAYPDYIGRPDTSLPDEIWQLLFPVRHWETISEQAGKAKLDPTLILGIIRQESAFEEKARSRANARGLMQILPSTGRALARQARVTRYTTTKLYQAQTNITLGTRHLSYLLQQFGKLELALAAYNAGKSRVDRWLKEFGDEDMAQFVEQIPFSETRNYVKQVLGNKAHYDRLTSSSVSAKH